MLHLPHMHKTDVVILTPEAAGSFSIGAVPHTGRQDFLSMPKPEMLPQGAYYHVGVIYLLP